MVKWLREHLLNCYDVFNILCWRMVLKKLFLRRLSAMVPWSCNNCFCEESALWSCNNCFCEESAPWSCNNCFCEESAPWSCNVCFFMEDFNGCSSPVFFLTGLYIWIGDLNVTRFLVVIASTAVGVSLGILNFTMPSFSDAAYDKSILGLVMSLKI